MCILNPSLHFIQFIPIFAIVQFLVMEDKLQILEKFYQDTGLTLHKDVLRCKSLLAEFVQQISEASELLSLDVVYGESPKFDWLKECLQKRIEVKFFDERNESDLLRGDQNQVNESQTGQITHPDYSQENVAENCYTDEEYDSVMMVTCHSSC